MTKKDYELIAEILDRSAQSHALNPFTNKCLYAELVSDFANALAGTNERFNRALFVKACGVEL